MNSVSMEENSYGSRKFQFLSKESSSLLDDTIAFERKSES
jgi:hypothetical protein